MGKTLAERAPGAFWAFTLESYGREGVQSAVLDLQNRRGADVNLLFFCCFVAATGRGRLSRADLSAADAAIDSWRRQVTLPLRRLRDHIKGSGSLWSLPGAPEVRGKVLGAEIESERITQGLLEAQAPAARSAEESGRSPLDDAAQSLRAYLTVLAVEMDGADIRALGRLLQGTFPDHAPADIAAVL